MSPGQSLDQQIRENVEAAERTRRPFHWRQWTLGPDVDVWVQLPFPLKRRHAESLVEWAKLLVREAEINDPPCYPPSTTPQNPSISGENHRSTSVMNGSESRTASESLRGVAGAERSTRRGKSDRG